MQRPAPGRRPGLLLWGGVLLALVVATIGFIARGVQATRGRSSGGGGPALARLHAAQRQPLLDPATYARRYLSSSVHMARASSALPGAECFASRPAGGAPPAPPIILFDGEEGGSDSSGSGKRVACRAAREAAAASVAASLRSARDDGLVVQSDMELGYELLAAAPWAFGSGGLRLTAGTEDSAPFFFFSPRHCERRGAQRRYRPLRGHPTSWPHDDGPNARLINALVNRSVFTGVGAAGPRWRVPPFHGHYCGRGLTPWGGRRIAVLWGKRNLAEWGGPSVNVISPATLARLFTALAGGGYVVVYHRATPGLFPSEVGGFSAEQDDFAALEAAAVGAYGPHAATDWHPAQRLVLLPRYLAALRAAVDAEAAGAGGPDGGGGGGSGGPRFSANTVQLAALADADVHVAVQGGPAYLSLLWAPGRPVVLLQKRGLEVQHGAVGWFDRLAGARVVSTDSEEELVPLAMGAAAAAAAAAASAPAHAARGGGEAGGAWDPGRAGGEGGGGGEAGDVDTSAALKARWLEEGRRMLEGAGAGEGEGEDEGDPDPG